MAILEQQEFQHPEGRTILLSYKLNRFAPSLRRIRLIERHRLAELGPSGRMAVWFEFLHPPSRLRRGTASGSLFSLLPDMQTPPEITVVASPGISVELDGFRDQHSFDLQNPALAIYRVQDPGFVPPIGSPFSLPALTRNYVIDGALSFDSRIATEAEENQFRNIDTIIRPVTGQPYSRVDISRLPGGVAIRHPSSDQTLLIQAPMFRNLLQGAQGDDSTSRFAYEINPDARRDGDPPLVRIVKTGRVTIGLDTAPLFWLREQPDPSQRVIFWDLFEADGIDNVPPQGAPLHPPRRGWRRVRRGGVRRIPPWWEPLVISVFDMEISFIPQFGDLVDIGEFIYAFITSRDRWGRPVSTADKVVMGIGAALPFVGGAALRGLDNVINAFGHNADSARRLIDRLEDLRLPERETEFLRQMAAKIRQGGRLSRAEFDRVHDIVRRLGGERNLSLDDLLTIDESGFAHMDIQEAYQGRRNTTLGPREWARTENWEGQSHSGKFARSELRQAKPHAAVRQSGSCSDSCRSFRCQNGRIPAAASIDSG